MKPSGEFFSPPVEEKARKAQLHTELGSLRRDWFKEKGIELSGKGYRELKAVVKEFYKENGPVIKEVLESEGETVEGELSTLAKKSLDSSKVAAVRSKLGLSKWVSLAETVAFIKTAVDLDNQELQKKYVEYCAKGISLDDMRNVLAYENDVKPARIDTDIYHQSPQRSRSGVEIVSNAVDAVNSVSYTIGRFGVGFYQILSHLKNEEDYVKVKTGNKDEGFYEIDFRLRDGEMQTHLEENPNQTGDGTTVELHMHEFPQEEATQLIKKHFAYNHVAQVYCNGELVNDLSNFGIDQSAKPKIEASINENGYVVKDSGHGMSPQVILEKLLVPKFSGKRPVQELVDLINIDPTYIIERRKPDDKEPGKAVVNVGGVMIEEVELKGVNTVKTLVVDLPPFTMLGEERNSVAIDDVTIRAMKKLVDKATASGDVQIINSIAPMIGGFQRRSLKPEEENNMVAYLQDRTSEALPKDINCLPNIQGFERVRLPDTILVDTLAKQTNWAKVPGLKTPKLDGQGWMVYVAPMDQKKESPVVMWRNRLVMSQEIYDKFAADPTLVNLYLQALQEGEGINIRKLSSKQENLIGTSEHTEKKEKQYSGFADYVQSNWRELGYPNKDSLEVSLGALSKEVSERGDLIYKHIINRFPDSVTNYFVDMVLSGKKNNISDENFANFASLAQNPDLVRTMVELNISLNNYGEATRQTFPGQSASQAETNDPKGKWYNKEYWGHNNLIHEGGEVFFGAPTYGRSTHREISDSRVHPTFGLVALNRGGIDGKLQFIDAQTRAFHPVEFPIREGDGFTCFTFGGKRYVLVGNVHRYWGGKAFIGSTQESGGVYDFNTGEKFDPAPQLGRVVSLEEEGLIYELQKNNKKRGDEDKMFKYNSDGTTEPYNPLDGLKKKEETESVVKRVTDKSAALVLNGKVIHRTFYKNLREGWEDWTINYSTKIKNHEENGKKYVLWESRKETGAKFATPYDLRDNGHGTFELINVETILFDENGQKVFSLKPNQKIIFADKDSQGKLVFAVVQYKGAALNDEENTRISFWPAIKEVYYVDSSGARLPVERFAEMHPVRYQTGAIYENGKVSAYQGDTWKVEFVPGTGPRTHGNNKSIVTASIVDRQTGEIIEEQLRDIVYDPNTGLWRCSAYLGSTEQTEGEEKVLWRTFYIDSKGNIVKETKVGNRTSRADYSKEFANLPHPLSEQKTIIMNRVLEGYETADKRMMEKFLVKCSQYANLSDEAFSAIAPVLLRVDFLDQRLLEDQRIVYLDGRLKEFNPELRVQFYDFLSQLLPDIDNLEDMDSFIEKFLKIFQDKIANNPEAEREEIYNTFKELRDYENGKYLATGWNIVRFKTPIGSELIPERIRPIVDYLRADEHNALAQAAERIEFSSQSSFTLSQLIQSKRLNETLLQNFFGNAAELEQIVESKTKGKKQDHIQREIIHPIYYQSVNDPYLFIRELTQNAHDAVLKSTDPEQKAVSMDVFSRNDKEVTLRIEDSVGMSLQKVLNYFLIPGESTKLNDKETIGYFGQGLFTLFRGAKEVILKTSKGDGQITKLRITPLQNDKGMTIDLNLTIEQEEGEFKGTHIERTVDSNFPSVEAAYIKNAACTFTSLVDGKVIDIKLNGSDINKPQQILASVEVPGSGTISLYDAPNNVITQRGLFIKPIDDDFKTGLYDVEKLLAKRGYVLNIPDHIGLTRSRNEIARKEDVVPGLKEYLPLLKLKAYIEIFRQDIQKGHVIQLDNLPYDYFYSGYPTGGKIFEDAKKLRNAQPITDVKEYLERGSLIQLLVLLPVVELDDQAWSWAELKEAALKDTPPLENEEKYHKLPNMIREKLQEGKRTYESHSQQRREAQETGRMVKDFVFADWQKQPEFVRKQIREHLPEYTRMYELSQDLNLSLAISIGHDNIVETTFYVEPAISSAHAGQAFNMIGYNLSHWKGWRVSSFEEANTLDRNLREFYHAYSHEYAHIEDKSSHFTHNQDFYRKQAEVLSRLMYARLEQK